jgi:hypothetical protein
MKQIVLAMVLVILASLMAQAQSVPPLVNYQGMLTDANGNALTGTKKIEFNLYDAATGGNKVWGPQVFSSVPLVNGMFNVILGTTDTAGRSIAEAFGGKDRYLGIKVDDGNELEPRQQILSTPFAIQAANGVPPGTIIAFGGMNVPAGYLLCDGKDVSRTTYANLFNAIGTAWGEGDGSTTFHLPDLRGRFLRGVDGGMGIDPDAGSRTASNNGGNTGDNVGSIQDDEFKSHKHSSSIDGLSLWYFGANWGMNPSGWSMTTAPFGINPSGGNETRPKNAYVQYIIKY